MKVTRLVILSILTLLVNQEIFSQSKIDGIGIFKINKTSIGVLASLIGEGYSLDTCNSSFTCSQYLAYGMKIYEMVNDTIKPDRALPIIKDYRIFVIGEYKVSGINIKALELHFYNGILFKIKSTNGDLELHMPLREKYNGKVEIAKKEIICESRFGNFTKVETTITTTYRDDEQIKAFSVLRKYFDDKCEESSYTYTVISDVKSEKIVVAKTSLLRKKMEEEQALKRKTELNKL